MAADDQPPGKPAHDAQLKQVLRHLPAPVGIVSSYDPDSGDPVGLAMSALMPVSLEPCSMAIAINRSGSAHDAMIRAGRFCINLLDSTQHAHLTPFASFAGRSDRFTHSDWRQHGPVWFLEGAPANIFCEIRQRLSYGTHDLLIGEIYHLRSTGGDDILGWANGALGRLSPLRDT
ncbi:MAG: flavin reductase [Sphingomonadales bacterium]|nr:flavin reductase [Sphingomonadales bacterium]